MTTRFVIWCDGKKSVEWGDLDGIREDNNRVGKDYFVVTRSTSKVWEWYLLRKGEIVRGGFARTIADAMWDAVAGLGVDV